MCHLHVVTSASVTVWTSCVKLRASTWVCHCVDIICHPVFQTMCVPFYVAVFTCQTMGVPFYVAVFMCVPFECCNFHANLHEFACSMSSACVYIYIYAATFLTRASWSGTSGVGSPSPSSLSQKKKRRRRRRRERSMASAAAGRVARGWPPSSRTMASQTSCAGVAGSTPSLRPRVAKRSMEVAEPPEGVYGQPLHMHMHACACMSELHS